MQDGIQKTLSEHGLDNEFKKFNSMMRFLESRHRELESQHRKVEGWVQKLNDTDKRLSALKSQKAEYEHERSVDITKRNQEREGKRLRVTQTNQEQRQHLR